MGKLELYYNTIIHLRSGQVVHQCLNRLRKLVRRLLRKQYDFSLYRQGTALQLIAPIDKYESCSGDSFTFLNLTERFDGSWEYKHLGALWSFNINYMEYLLQPSMDVVTGRQWIMRFISSQATNAIGLSPYCIALRSVNWIKFLTANRATLTAEDIATIETSPDLTFDAVKQAGVLIFLVPLLAVYLFAQRWLVENLESSGLVG